MTAIPMPPFFTQFMDWVEENPALGAVVVLIVAVVLLWLLRKSLKFFMVAAVLLGITILGSYYYYGSQTTNEAVKRGAQQVSEHSKELIEKTLEGIGLQSSEPENGLDFPPEVDPKSESEG